MRYLLLIFTALAFSASQAQSKVQYAQNAEQEFIKGNYIGSAYAFQKIYDTDTTNIEIAYKLADSYLNYFAYKKAYHYFELVNASNQRTIFIDALYHMAMINKFFRNYELSEKQFAQYVKEANNKSSYLYLSAVQELKSAKQIQVLVKDSVKCTVMPISSLNTVNAEFSPRQHADTNLYFSAMRGLGKEQYRIGIYQSSGREINWQKENVIQGFNAGEVNSANIAFNNDFTKFIYSSCVNNSSCELKLCVKNDTGWSVPVALGEQINIKGFVSTHPNWTKIGEREVLFFVSNRAGGRGKLDVWYSEAVNGEFTSAKNAGAAINTPSDDITPYYSLSDTALYFSSDWHAGVGGTDIFYAKGVPGQFKNPINIGVPINSSRNDQYFVVNEKGEAFFSSHREGTLTENEDAICCSDLYHVQLNKRKVKPMPQDTLPYKLIEAYVELPLVLYFHNDEPNPRTRDTLTKYTYMETYDAYKKLVPDYVSKYPEGLEGEEKLLAAEDIQRFFDDYVDLGVENLHRFTTDLLKYLEQGYSAEVLIKGFASPLTTSSYNVNLSLRRISSLINYLKKYNGGVYVPYFDGTAANGAKLTFIKNPNGEYKSAAGVSDDYYDVRNSIYNPHAAIERRIEVVRVNLIPKEPKEIPYFDNFRKMEINLDTISGDKVTHKIYLRNTSDEAWTVEDLGADCSCTQLRWDKQVVSPGDFLTLEFIINLAGKKGEKYNIISFKKSNNKEFQAIELKYFVE